ncbi:MAG: hypothetical protein SVW02_00510 [Candidatus Nanohaloarchaea archaeon]|nr:hypothetical protein [Candidatus Nanohaloarchaea archaeon]
MVHSIGVVGAGHWARRLRTGIDNGRFSIDKAVDVVPYDEKADLLQALGIDPDNYYRISPEDSLPDAFFDGLDVVHIASPVEYHKEQTMEALRNDVLTVTEKSYGANREEFEEVMRFLDERKLWSRSILRLHYLQKLPTIAMSGVIEQAVERHGPVREVQATFIEEVSEEDRGRNWLFEPRNGGILLDWIHPIEVLSWACDARFAELREADGFIVEPSYTEDYPTAVRATYNVEGDFFGSSATATVRVGKGFEPGQTHKAMRFVFDDAYIDFKYVDSEIEFETDKRGSWEWKEEHGDGYRTVYRAEPSGPISNDILVRDVGRALDGSGTPLGQDTIRRMYEPVWTFNENGGFEDPVRDEERIEAFVDEALRVAAPGVV